MTISTTGVVHYMICYSYVPDSMTRSTGQTVGGQKKAQAILMFAPYSALLNLFKDIDIRVIHKFQSRGNDTCDGRDIVDDDQAVALVQFLHHGF